MPNANEKNENKAADGSPVILNPPRVNLVNMQDTELTADQLAAKARADAQNLEINKDQVDNTGRTPGGVIELNDPPANGSQTAGDDVADGHPKNQPASNNQTIGEKGAGGSNRKFIPRGTRAGKNKRYRLNPYQQGFQNMADAFIRFVNTSARETAKQLHEQRVQENQEKQEKQENE